MQITKEEKIELGIIQDAPQEKFDSTKKYSDEYYEQYIENFQPNTKKRYFYRFVKRSFDLVMSFLALICLSWFMLIIAIAIKCDSKGPIIFKQ